MIAHFYFKRWNPPELSPEEQHAIGRNVADRGVLYFTLRFIRLPTPGVISSGVTKQQVFDYWFVLLAYIAMAVVGGIAGEWGNSIRNKLIETVGATFFAIGFLGAIVFLASVLIVSIQYAWWLRGLRNTAAKGSA